MTYSVASGVSNHENSGNLDIEVSGGEKENAQKEERDLDPEEESKSNKAIRTRESRGERPKRDDDNLTEKPPEKMIKTTKGIEGKCYRRNDHK